MKPITKILVPIDVSDLATEAVAFAADLARRYDATLQIIYVDQPLTYALPEGYALASPEQLAGLAAAFKQGVDDARRAALAAGAPRVQGTVLHGHAVAKIVEYAKQGKSDLIVIGSHGRKGLAHVLLGSVAENVLRAAPCPVLTVRTSAAA